MENGQKETCISILQDMAKVIYNVGKEDALERSFNIQVPKPKLLVKGYVSDNTAKTIMRRKLSNWLSGMFHSVIDERVGIDKQPQSNSGSKFFN